MRSLIFSVGLTLSAAAFSMSAAEAQLVNVQFAGNFSFNCGDGTNSCSNAQQTGAGYVGVSGDTWNYFNTGSGATSLLNADGSVSAISISFAADGGFGPYADGADVNNFYGTSYANLFGGYLYSYNPNGITLTLSGLPANRAFDLYTYSEQDGRDSVGRSADVSVNGFVQRDTQTGPGTFVEGDTYLHFAGVADANGRVNVSVSTVNVESDLDGLQLSVAVPET